MKLLKYISSYVFVAFLAVMTAVNYIIFVFPNSFAPAGIDGICTMIQDVTHLNIGYLSLLVNIPLLAIGYIFLNKEFVFKSAVYVAVFSVAAIFLKDGNIEKFRYYTESGTSLILAPVTAGVIRGIIYVFTLNSNASAGGIDIIAAVIKKFNPHYSIMNILFFINFLIAISAYFVYGMKPEPVICSIIYAFLTTTVSNRVRRSRNETIKFEIISSDAQLLCSEITQDLCLPATTVDAHGAYSGANKQMVICVVKKHNAPLLEDIIHKYPDSVVFESIVSSSITEGEYRF